MGVVIPRTIHYCWLSDAPWDDLTTRCFESWRSHFAGYEFRRWDLRTVPAGIPFLERMLRGGDWAFAADYLRLYALATEGGVYLDLDVEVFRDFEPLLHDRAFMSYEDDQQGRLASHVMGAEPEHPFIRACLEFYDRSWRLEYSFPPTMPRIVTGVAERMLGYEHRVGGQSLGDGLRIYPATHFTPVAYTARHLSVAERYERVGEESYALHHWRHGWSWLDRPLREAIPRIPWLFMDLRDWRFVARHLFWRRLKSRARE